MAYQYSQLEGPSSVRLLRLQPGDSDQPIRCEIYPVSLDDNPSYTAVSYCWGSSEKPREILYSQYSLPITQSLHRMLWRLRLDETKPRLLWADAVCINQQDNDEKALQVPLMSRIYRQAQQVIVWLGDDETDSEGSKAISLLNQLVDAYQTQWCKEHDTRPYYHLASSGGLSRYNIPSPHDKRWVALGNILQRDWFKRMWIVQEVTLPEEDSIVVIMGSAFTTWKALSLAINYALTGLEILDIVTGPIGEDIESGILSPLKRLIEIRQMQEKHRTLLSLLISHRCAEASDPRDKLYALFSLATDLPRFPGLRPDYNIDTESLYILFATEMIKGSDNLDILSVPRVINHRQCSGKLPSWVPDWRNEEGTGVLSMSGYGVHRKLRFSACGESTSKPIISGCHLKVYGFRFDRVTDRSLAIHKNTTRVKTPFRVVSRHISLAFTDKVILDWERVARARSGICYPTGEKILDAYFLSMVCGFLPPGYTMDQFRVTDMRIRVTRPFDGLFRFLYWLGLASIFFPLFYVYEFLLAIGYLIILSIYGNPPELQMGMHFNRCMIRTYKGYIGLATELVQVGDLIALMEGGKVPLILRPGDERTWELVGDIYVHGVMSGEAWDGRKLEQFTLK